MIRAFFGDTGAGKTMTNTIIAITEIQNEDIYLNCCTEIDLLNEKGFNFSKPLQKHCVFSNYKIIDKSISGTNFETYPYNPFKFSLPTNNFDYDVFPPCACFHGQEAQSFLNSRKSMNFPDSASRAYENNRHANYTITLDLQRLDLCDINVRSIINEYFTFLNLEFFYNYCNVLTKVISHCICFKKYSDAEEFIKTRNLKLGELRDFEYQGDIFECYDSFANKEEFYKNSKNKDFKYLKWKDVKESLILPPEGYYSKVKVLKNKELEFEF